MKGTDPNLIRKISSYTFPVDCEDLLKIDELYVDNSTNIYIYIYLDEINMLLDTYTSLKRINKFSQTE